MVYVVYILINKSRSRTYVGQTHDLPARVELHNANSVRSTKGHGPWDVLYQEEHATRAEAMKREAWFKTRSGRKKIRDLILERWPSG